MNSKGTPCTQCIGNEIWETSKRVFTHQMSNGNVGWPKWGFVPYNQHRCTSGTSDLKFRICPYYFNSSHADICRCFSIEICGNLRKCSTSISFKDFHQLSMVSYLQGLLPVAPTSEIWCFTGYTISWYTREIVVHENINFLATREILCSISRSPTLMPRSEWLKSR